MLFDCQLSQSGNQIRLFQTTVFPQFRIHADRREAGDRVDFIQGDFREQAVLEQLLNLLDGGAVDLVMSDMAPNLSGNISADQAKSFYLAELARDMALSILRPQGAFLVKLFQGEGFDDYHRDMRKHFSQVVIRKPKASRPRSNEVYILAKGFKS